MTSPLLSLASGVLPEFGPVETVGAAIAAGWPASGVWIEPADWTDAIAREVRRRADDAGLTLLDAEVVWIRPGPQNPDHLRIIDAAAAIGARNVLTVSSDPNRAAAAEKLGALADHARSAGLRLSLEFGAFTEVKSLGEALDILDRAECAGADLLIDALHLARTGGLPADVARLDPKRLAYAQLCDAPATGPFPTDVPAIIEEAIDGRSAPGAGALPLEDLLQALPENLPLSLEVRSKRLREGWPDPAERARVLLEETQAFLKLSSVAAS